MTREACSILRELGTPCLIHQPKYSMLVRKVEDGLLDVLEEEGVGCIPFSPLAQGLLTDKYLNGIPEGSRADKPHGFLEPSAITEKLAGKLKKLNKLAEKRGQSLAQMALSWILRDNRITSVLIGASSVSQLQNSIACLNNTGFSNQELTNIDQILNG